MRTANYADPMAFDVPSEFTTGSNYAISAAYTATHYGLTSSDPDALAWSLSPLGDPKADDDIFDDLLGYTDARDHTTAVAKIRTGAKVAAILTGGAGIGATLGVALFFFVGTPSPLPTVVVPAASAPAPAVPHVTSPVIGDPAGIGTVISVSLSQR